jgi:hypothetical protein
LVDIECWAHERYIEAVYDMPSSKLNDDWIGRQGTTSECCANIEDIVALNTLVHSGIDPKRVFWDTTSF